MVFAAQEILSCVFFIKVGEAIGTCFAVKYKDEKYLVTAKHMFGDAKKDTSDIAILRNGSFIQFEVKIFYSCIDEVDIVVMKSDLCKNLKTIDILDTQPDMSIGQELYFAGFPFGIDPGNYDLNEGFPIPFVKHAYLSSANGKKGYAHLWLDGVNNPGFSGGPIIYEMQEKKSGVLHQFLAGVISSYRCDIKTVLDKKTHKPTEYIYQENSGIINAHGRKSIIDIIKQNNI